MSVKADVFAVSPQGYEVHLAIESEDKVYAQFIQLCQQLAKDGFLPRHTPAVGSSHTGTNGTTPHICQTHQTEYKRFEKDGKVWFSHPYTENDQRLWCREGK